MGILDRLSGKSETFGCAACGGTFPTKAALESHAREHHAPKPAAEAHAHEHEHLSCCGQTFHGREAFERHRAAVHLM
ncbi:MAG: hypothetical protein ACT4PT_07770 [Methanobacteriota archaeon]